MENYFTFDGVDSRTYNTYIATSNMFDAPEENVETISIPYKNTPVHISEGTFKPFQGKAVCYIPADMQNKIDDLRNFLKSKFKSCRYTEALRPGEYRMARYKQAFEVDKSDRQTAVFALTFECSPQRFLVSGDTPVVISSNTTINNTNMPSSPLIRAYGTGTLTIGDYTITINTVDTYVDIDCETKQCFKGDVNCGGNVELTEYPLLVSGENAVTLDGLSRIEITPRWWRL